jgi:hypothetical protein
MTDLRDKTKGELRYEVLALRKLVSKIYRDCYEMKDEYGGRPCGTEERGYAEQADAIMTMIDEYRKNQNTESGE